MIKLTPMAISLTCLLGFNMTSVFADESTPCQDLQSMYTKGFTNESDDYSQLRSQAALKYQACLTSNPGNPSSISGSLGASQQNSEKTQKSIDQTPPPKAAPLQIETETPTNEKKTKKSIFLF